MSKTSKENLICRLEIGHIIHGLENRIMEIQAAETSTRLSL